MVVIWRSQWNLGFNSCTMILIKLYLYNDTSSMMYNGTSTMILLQWYLYNDTSTMILLQWYFYNDTSTMILLQWYLYNDTSTMILVQWYLYNDTCKMILVQWYLYNDTCTMILLQWWFYQTQWVFSGIGRFCYIIILLATCPHALLGSCLKIISLVSRSPRLPGSA